AWEQVRLLQKADQNLPPEFLESLRKASPNEEPTNAVQLVPHWKKGEKLRFEIVNTTQNTRDGKVTLKRTTRTDIDVEVLRVDQNGYVVRWRFGETRFDDPKQAEQLGKEIGNLIKNGSQVILEIDSEGSIT